MNSHQIFVSFWDFFGPCLHDPKLMVRIAQAVNMGRSIRSVMPHDVSFVVCQLRQLMQDGHKVCVVVDPSGFLTRDSVDQYLRDVKLHDCAWTDRPFLADSAYVVSTCQSDMYPNVIVVPDMSFLYATVARAIRTQPLPSLGELVRLEAPF